MTWDEGINPIDPAYKVAAYDGTPLRVVAGPGTGKTFALMRRVARLLSANVNPERMLVVTFTRAAAQDLKKELSKLATPNARNVITGTLHSFCFSLLQKARVFNHTHRVARPLLEFEERFLHEDINHKEVFGNVHQRKQHIQALAAAWAREQDQIVGALSDTDRLFQQHLLEWLQFHDAVLLAELVPITLRYLKSNPNLPERRQFDHVLVDEYQDLNSAEQSLLDLLSENGKLTVVGDEDQSIYEDLRFAHPEGISGFGTTHEDTYDVPMTECRRCPKHVVAIANELIRNNREVPSHELVVRPSNIDGDIHIVQWDNMESEANGIADYISTKISKREFDPGKTLVLSPSRVMGYKIRDALRDRNVSAYSFFTEQILDGDPKDLEKCQAQEAFALLTMLVNPNDKAALRCYLGFGNSSLNTNAYARLKQHCAKSGDEPKEALNKLCDGSLKIPHVGGIVDRYRILAQHLSHLTGKMGHDLFNALFPEGAVWADPFHTIAKNEGLDDTWGAEEIFKALHTNVIQPELPTDVPYVRIMSLHKSKGLNADHVIVMGCIQGLIPMFPKGEYTFDKKQRYNKEQRRLFYVALTRTKHTLVLSSILSIPRTLAHKLGVSVKGGQGNRDVAKTITSTFIDELGASAPKSVVVTF